MRRRHPAYFAVAALVLLTGSGGSCSDREREGTTPSPAPSLPPAELRLVLLTDLDGYLEPCGCTSRPLGGIDRMAAQLAELRAEGPPTVVLAAGNLFFHGAPHGADVDRARDQELMRSETLRDILRRLELTAATPGALDFSYGAERFTALARESGAAWVAAGARLAGAEPPVLGAVHRAEVGGLDVAVVGVADLRRSDGALPEGLTLEDPVAAARAALSGLEADLVIALVSGDRRLARRVSGLDGVDLVVHGGIDEAEARPPTSGEGAPVLTAGRQGQGLTVVELRRGEGGWTDASEWTRESQREHARERVEAQERRVAEWAADESTAPEDLASQRRRLEALRRELEALQAPPSVSGAYFRARYVELPPEAPRAAEVTAMMRALDRRTNEHNRELFADWRPAPAPEGTPHYVGSARCATCHASAMTWWRGHAHGRAYETLETRDKNYNLSCVGCHVTGYLDPGGSTVTQPVHLRDVGCESCHGAGSMHASDPTGAAVNVQRAPVERTCRRCHTPDHSDHFLFEAYRQMVIVPGHGAPLEARPE